MNQNENIILTVHRSFTQSAEKVFDAWLDVDKAKHFMFATETGEMIRCEIDPRVGGSFVMTDRRPDGDVEHTGTYLVIDRPRQLVFTFGIPAISSAVDLVTIDIAPTSNGCDVTLTSEMKPEWAEYADGAREGWTKIMATLATNIS